ncbi:MAG: hypothetical protein ACJ77A_14875 [Actinomycetota bacterium]
MPSLRRIRLRAASSTPGEDRGGSKAVRRYAGPAAIVLAVVVVLHQLLFGTTIATHIDLMSFWLPQFCFLGKALAAGHIPSWNPHVMAGVPFASDPQSGWMNLPAMLLFAATPCGTALRLYLFVQPVIAGLGMYAFLRADRTSRAAATAGGLVLALVLAGSFFGPYVPFSASLAWTPVLLAAGARYLRASTWSGRLGWLLAAGLAWGQVAAAHFSDGMAIATVVLFLYVVIRSLQRDVGWKLASGRVLLLFAVIPLVNLAAIVPRLAYLPRTSLGLGYGRLDDLTQRLTGHSGHTFFTGYRLLSGWPFDLLRSPGLYLGAAGVALVAVGWASRRNRGVVAGFTAFAVICYLLSVNEIAKHLSSLSSSSLGAAYIHAPSRLRFAVVLTVAILVGYGVEGWRVARNARTRLLLVVPGVVVWWGGALLFARPFHELLLFLVVAAVTVVVLVAMAGRPALVAVLPLLIGVELVVNGLAAYPDAASTYPRPVSIDSWLRPPRMVGLIQAQGSGRYMSYAPRELGRSGGYLGHQEPTDAPLLGNGQSMLFGLREAQGYNPVQLLRFWEFFRYGADSNINYNASFLKHVSPLQLDLLQVAFLIQPAGRVQQLPGTDVAREGTWTLRRVQDPSPRASLLTSCRSVPDSDAALRAVYEPGFDPGRVVVLDSGPSVPCGPQQPGGTADELEPGPQEVRIDVRAPSAGVVLVRNSWDEHWHATVDGRPAPVVHADYLLQGVPVPAGRHSVVLRYDDPPIGYGLGGSAAVVALMAAAMLVARRRERRHSAAAATAGQEPVRQTDTVAAQEPASPPAVKPGTT